MKDSLIKGLHLKVGLRHTFKEAQPRNLSKTMMAAAFILKKTKQSAIQKDLREWHPTIASRLTSLVFVSKVRSFPWISSLFHITAFVVFYLLLDLAVIGQEINL